MTKTPEQSKVDFIKKCKKSTVILGLGSGRFREGKFRGEMIYGFGSILVNTDKGEQYLLDPKKMLSWIKRNQKLL